MSDKRNGDLVTRIILSILVGISAASLVAGFLGRFVQQTGVRADLVLLIGISALAMALVIQAVQKRKRISAQKGGLEPSGNLFDGIVIGLLLFTSLLSGPYLILVPVASIVLIMIYILIRMRRGRSDSQDQTPG